MIDINKKYQEDMKYLKENHSKEIKEYEKIGNRENFNKIIHRVKKLNKYLVELDSFYSDEDKILGITNFNTDELRIYFKFYDFYDFDARADIEKYLEGEKYSLDMCFKCDFIDFKILETAYKCMSEIKNIIDDVISGGSKNERNND